MTVAARKSPIPSRRRFVAVLIEGRMHDWEGPDPGSDKTAKKAALDKAEWIHLKTGKQTVAVVVEHILATD